MVDVLMHDFKNTGYTTLKQHSILNGMGLSLGLSLTVYHTTSPGHIKQPESLSMAHAHYTVQATVNDLGHSIYSLD